MERAVLHCGLRAPEVARLPAGLPRSRSPRCACPVGGLAHVVDGSRPVARRSTPPFDAGAATFGVTSIATADAPASIANSRRRASGGGDGTADEIGRCGGWVPRPATSRTSFRVPAR
jgi:hypothetical protein